MAEAHDAGSGEADRCRALHVAAPQGRCNVTTYILLLNWTDQGIRNARESPKRLDAARKELSEMGGAFKELFLTMGDCDMVAVCEAPDDAVIARFALRLGM